MDESERFSGPLSAVCTTFIFIYKNVVYKFHVAWNVDPLWGLKKWGFPMWPMPKSDPDNYYK